MYNLPSIAILIDMWELPPNPTPERIYRRRKFGEHVYSYCITSPYIKGTSVNTYDNNGNVDNLLTYQDLLQSLQSSNTQLLSLCTPVDVNEFLTMNRHIKNVYIMGGLFDICCQNRPVGYRTINQYIPHDINILIDVTCMRFGGPNKKAEFIKHHQGWEKLTDTIYKFIR